MAKVTKGWTPRRVANGTLYSPPAPALGEGPHALVLPVPEMLGGELPGSVKALVMGGVRFVREEQG